MLDTSTVVARRHASPRTTASDSQLTGLDRAAVPRLRMLAAIYAGAQAVVLVVMQLGRAGVITLPPIAPHDSVALGSAFVASLAVLAATFTRWSARLVIAMGIVYQLAGTFCITFFEEGAVVGRAIPMACVWIMSFTLLPSRPLRAALVAYGAAAMGPLAMLVQAARGTRSWPIDPGDWFEFGFVWLAATISVLATKVIYGLRREVVDAKKLGAYQLVEKLGYGGMGEVWRAKHSALARPAAIKLMRAELTAKLSPAELEVVTERFHREVQATAQLRSPHTVAVYDFGQTQDGTLYYVMELLDGFDLETLIVQHGPQPPERVVHLIRQAAESLAEAHRRGLVHRDIKPANLYATALGIELDFVKVLDFGLVRDLSRDKHLTAAGAVWGTPAYLAPESAARNQFDSRSDVYALGSVAYWLLTGKTVFDAETGAAMLAAQIRDEPAPPSQRTELAIPADLEALVMACLVKDPDARPQTADELIRRLDALKLPAWTPRRAEAWWRANVPDILARSNASCRDAEAPKQMAVKPTVRAA